MAKTYARIDNNTVAELIDLPEDVAPADAFVPGIAATLVDLTDISPVPYGGWTYDGKSFGPPVLDPNLAWATYRASAQAALDRSDTTLLRCIEGGVAVPADWASYRKTLRAIVSAKTAPSDWTAATALPSQPAYPAGT